VISLVESSPRGSKEEQAVVKNLGRPSECKKKHPYELAVIQRADKLVNVRHQKRLGQRVLQVLEATQCVAHLRRHRLALEECNASAGVALEERHSDVEQYLTLTVVFSSTRGDGGGEISSIASPR
jgi:hypothetical protein